MPIYRCDTQNKSVNHQSRRRCGRPSGGHRSWNNRKNFYRTNLAWHDISRIYPGSSLYIQTRLQNCHYAVNHICGDPVYMHLRDRAGPANH